MKGLLIAATLAFSAGAFAIDANSSWGQINASLKTDVRAPQVGFAAGEATTFYNIFDVCIDGDVVKTTEAKDVFEQVRVGKNVELKVVGQEVLSHPRTYSVVVTGSHNEAPKTITYTIAQDNKIEVYSAKVKNQEQTLLFTKSFSIPACK